MKIQSQAVHVGDRKRTGSYVAVTAPIYTAASYFYDRAETLDRVFAHEEHGYAYARFDNPTNAALEELVAKLENGYGALACASGMAALQIALTAALIDRRKKVLAATAIYGATIKLLMNVFEPMGVAVSWVDICDLDAVAKALETEKPGCLVMESISNPLLRVGEIDRVAALCRASGTVLMVDNTFASPMLVRPLDLGAHYVVHSLTKYLNGHGDVLGGIIVTSEHEFEPMRQLARTYGPLLGPFEAYLAMRGVKTFPLRMERQCHNATVVAAWLASHPKVERVYFPGNPDHPDAAAIRRLFPANLHGAMVAFDIRGAKAENVFAFMDALKMVVPATSLGDVHTMVLYPNMSSHRDVPPKQRERLGIRDCLVRLSVGIEAVEDIIADLDQALAAC